MQRQVLSNRTVVSGHSMTSKYLETQRKREREDLFVMAEEQYCQSFLY